MPNKKKKSAASGTRGQASRGTQQKPEPQKSTKTKERSFLRDTIVALVLFGVAACVFVCLFAPQSSPFCRLVSGVLRGLLGAGGYLFPVLLIFVGVIRMLSQERVVLKGTVSALFVVLLAAFINILAYDVHNAVVEGQGLGVYITDLWQKGNEALFGSGGVLGGALSVPLVLFAGKAISGILVFLVMVGILVYVTGISFADFLGTPEERREKREQRELERAKQAAARADATERSYKPEDLKKDKDVLVNVDGDVPEEPAFLRGKDGLRRKKPSGVLLDVDDDASEKPSVRSAGVKNGSSLPKEEPAPVPEEEVITKEDILRAKHEVEKQVTEQERVAEDNPYVFPPVDLLAKGKPMAAADEEELRETGEKLCDVLREFSVETHVVDVTRGPTVTRYELAPEAGVRISKITNLSDDIALNLAAKGVRIEAPIPGKAAVGIEVPNPTAQVVRLREVLDTDTFRQAESKISVALGKDIAGDNIVIDISKMPHLLVAGATGTGKSVCINSMLISFLYKATPNEVKLILVDPKMVEFNVFRGIPHLLVPVVTDPKKAAGALAWAVMEMDARYEKLAMKNVRDINGYNRNLSEGEKKMPHIVIVIDELADLMMASPKEVEESVCRLAQKARAAGMHLIIATQRPSADVVTGLIKANIPSRIALAVSSSINSRIILDEVGAEKLLGKGDMLYDPMGALKPMRLQGCYVSDKEVENIVDFIKKNTSPSDYDAEIEKKIEKAYRDQQNKGKGGTPAGEDGEDDGADDEMLERAIDTIVEIGQASTSMLQRRVGLGYARAARLIDVMEKRHIVGPYQGSKPREVLISQHQWEEMKMNGLKEPAQDSAPAQTEAVAEDGTEA